MYLLSSVLCLSGCVQTWICLLSFWCLQDKCLEKVSEFVWFSQTNQIQYCFVCLFLIFAFDHGHQSCQRAGRQENVSAGTAHMYDEFYCLFLSQESALVRYPSTNTALYPRKGLTFVIWRILEACNSFVNLSVEFLKTIESFMVSL